MRADRDAAAIGDAVQPGLVAGQPAHAFRQIERAALAHPMAEEIKPEARHRTDRPDARRRRTAR